MIKATLFYGDDIYSKASLISIKNLPCETEIIKINDKISEEYKITKVPCIVMTTSNQDVCRITGNVTRDQIIDKIHLYEKVDI